MTMETTASWLADGVREIAHITRASAIVEPKIFNLDQEKDDTYAIITPGPSGQPNKIEIRTAGPDWHHEQLADPKQLAEFITSMESRDVDPAKGAAYIGTEAVMYVFDFEDRRHRATCPLRVSDPWKWLAQSQKPLSQREIIRELRIRFDGCLPRDSDLIALLRNIRWKSDGTMDANIQKGKEALGRQIMREVTGVADFPEEFSLTLNVFENVKQPVTVRVALEILTDAEKFEVIPFPNQIAAGMDETLAWLQSDLAQTGVPTFIGWV